jgi:dihydrofolate reductase
VTDGLASAVQQARAVAGGKDVAIAGGGSIVRQALAAGLVDELELHVSPVVLGEDSGCSTPAWVSVAALPFRAGRAIRAVGR